VHRGQDFLGDVLGLDEGNQAELGLALGADDLDPEGASYDYSTLRRNWPV
jgi:hypothetical protein